MRSRRALAGALVVVAVLSGCGDLASGGTFPPASADLPVGPGEMETPPLASINGVEGVLRGYSWRGGFADFLAQPPNIVYPPDSKMPRVTPPLRVALPLPAEMVGVTALNPLFAISHGITDGVIDEPLPTGTLAVEVSVLFRDGGSATYFWGVDDLIGRRTPTPSPSP